MGGISILQDEVAVIRQTVENSASTMFGHKVGWMEPVKVGISIIHRGFVLPLVFRNEVPGIADMTFGPLKFMELAEILDKVLISLERLGNLSQINYSGSCEFIPSLPDNGMGYVP
jgi:hypothetical protein